MDFIESTHGRLRPILITVKYETEDRVRMSQRFRITGPVVAKAGTLKKTSDTSYEPVLDGVTAWISQITVEAI